MPDVATADHADPRPPANGGRGPKHAAILEVARMMSNDLDRVARELSEMIHVHISELDQDLRLATHESCRANLGGIMMMLCDGTRPALATPPPEALAYAKEYVRRGLGLETLQRAYRTGQATLSRMWLHELRMRADDAEQLADTFGFFNDWLFEWVETLEHRLTEYYMVERERRLRGTSAMRSEQVRTILDGSPVDVRNASATLRYELDRRHVAYIVWTEATLDAPNGLVLFRAMERVAADVAAFIGATDHLTVPLGGYLACWAGFRQAPQGQTLAGHLPLATNRWINVALGQTGEGIGGFRRSHEEAVLARRVHQLRSQGRQPACVRFSDVALEVMLTQSREEARRFVAQQLGDLASEDKSVARLRETLRVFLEENGSFQNAAARLGVHKNTVAYRIRRVEELLGHGVRERQLELQTALRLAPLDL
jgi:PucR C-terminal helix-turn-helix domain/GGDEF-like domain